MSVNMDREWQDNFPLFERIIDYFKRAKFQFQRNVMFYGISGNEYSVDFLLNGENQDLGALVKDYRCAVKVTAIHEAAQILRDCPEINRVMVVGNRISGPALSLARRVGILTLSRKEIVSIYHHNEWPLYS